MIKKDDREFFLKNVMPYYGQLVKKLAYITNDIHLANDIVQDLMIDTLNSIERVKKYDNILGYLIDAGKKKAKKHFNEYKMLEFDDDNMDIVPAKEIIEDIVTEAEVGAELWENIEKLDEKYKHVLKLQYYHDMPLKEIANTLDKNYSTVRSLHKRALENLKAIYDTNKKSDIIKQQKQDMEDVVKK